MKKIVMWTAAAMLAIAVTAGLVWYASLPRTAAEQLDAARRFESRRLPRLVALRDSTKPEDKDARDNILAEVLEKYEQVRVKYPQAPEAAESAYRIYRIRDDNTSGAADRIALADRFLEENKDSPHAADVRWAAAELTQRDLKSPLDAIKRFEDFAEKHPKDARAAEARLRVGSIYEEIREWGAAKSAYEKVVADYPESKSAEEAQYRIGNILAERMEKKKEAVEAFKKLEEEHPGSRLARAAAGQRASLEEDVAKEDAGRVSRARRGGVREQLPWETMANELNSPLMDQIRSQGLDLISHDVTGGLDPESGRLQVMDTMTVAASREVSRTLTFQLEDGLEIAAVSVNGQESRHNRQGNFVQVDLGDLTLKAGEHKVSLAYTTAKSLATTDTESTTGIFLVGRGWLPILAYGDMATARMSLMAPKGVLLESQGEISVDDSGPTGTLFTWVQGKPVFYYVLVAAPYKTRTGTAKSMDGRDIGLTVYLFKDTNESFYSGYLDAVPGIIAFLESRLGPYPYDKVSIAQVRGFGGGIGSPGLLILGHAAFETTGVPATFLAHEMAHAWFGNEINLDLSKDSIPWLSEGFAQYWDALYLEQSKGRAAFVSHLRDLAENYYSAVSVLDDKPIRETPIGDPIYSALAYDKGAFVLHGLRGILGDAKFFPMMRSYVDSQRGKVATVSAFRAAAEEAHGEPLGWYFDRWIDGVGIPRYRVTRAARQTPSAPGTYAVETVIEQVDTTFTMPLDISVETSSGSEVTRVLVSEPVTTVTLTTAHEPQRVTIDPDYWVLKHPRRAEWDKVVTGGAPQ